MLAQSDAERERYEARRKAQLDYNTGLKVARMKGFEEGIEKDIEKGEKTGLIRTIQVRERFLNRRKKCSSSLPGLTRSLANCKACASSR
jgi:hypothetical protein